MADQWGELHQAGEQCGDNCKGECSGEVTGTPFCPPSERDKVLEALKKDLQTRIISSSNQWSKGRNSGLLECCNIIDELRQAGEP